MIAGHDTSMCDEGCIDPAHVPVVTPLSVRLDFAELQVSLRDDERRRLSGASAESSEVFCLTVSSAALSFARFLKAGVLQ